ncbi:unnamed protein product, partial [Mesorhabditis spiculigera]
MLNALAVSAALFVMALAGDTREQPIGEMEAQWRSMQKRDPGPSYDMYDPTSLFKRNTGNWEKRYYALDTLGGIGLGKRSGAAPESLKLRLRPAYDGGRFKKSAYNAYSLDSLGGMGLGKRDSSRGELQYFDSLGGIGLG